MDFVKRNKQRICVYCIRVLYHLGFAQQTLAQCFCYCAPSSDTISNRLTNIGSLSPHETISYSEHGLCPYAVMSLPTAPSGPQFGKGCWESTFFPLFLLFILYLQQPPPTCNFEMLLAKYTRETSGN